MSVTQHDNSHTPSVSLDDTNHLLSTLRRLAYQTPSPHLWRQICGLLDRCPPPSLAVAVDYVVQATRTWDLAPPCKYPDDWRWTDEVRLPDTAWLQDLALGRSSMKYNALVALDLEAPQIPYRAMIQFMNHPDLINIKRLNLNNRSLPGEFYQSLLQAPFFEGLTHLGLAHNTFERSHLAPFIARQAPSSITHLDLNGCRFASSTLVADFAAGSVWANLEHLSARLNDSGDACWEDDGLWIFLKNREATALKTLNFANCGSGPMVAQALGYGEHLTELTHLNLSWTNLEAYDLIPLFRAPHLRTLQHLDLSRNHFGGQGIGFLAQATHLDRLTTLSLSNNALRHDAVDALCRAPHLASVERLDLSGNPNLSDRSLLQLVDQGPFTSLQRLNFPFRSIDDYPSVRKVISRSKRLSDGLKMALEKTLYTYQTA